MQVAFKTRFAGDAEKPLFATKRINVYPANSTASGLGWHNLTEFWSGVNTVFTDAYKKETPDTAKPSVEAGGFKLELGGRQGWTPDKVKSGLKGYLGYYFAVSKEAVALFVKKIWTFLWNSENKFDAAKQLVENFSSTSAGSTNKAS